LHACPERYQAGAQASKQGPKPLMPRQTYQHPFLFCLALPLLKMFKHYLFPNKAVW
jgi:hypothetical protein